MILTMEETLVTLLELGNLKASKLLDLREVNLQK